MPLHLLIVAALLAVTGTVLIGVCCWPAISPRSRVRRARRCDVPVFGPDGKPLRRDDFGLVA
jgi:hypothetical protein